MTKEQEKEAITLLFHAMNEITGGPCQGLADDIQAFLNGMLLDTIDEVKK